jgi:hypothetical protein
MHGVARGTPRARVCCQRRKSSTPFLERVPAPPKQPWLETLLAQVIELVEVDLEHALVPAKLATERAEMVEAAGEPDREPLAGFILRLVELQRQIDIADLERAAHIGAEDPDLTHPRRVATSPFSTRPRRPSIRLSPPSASRGHTNARPKRGESVPSTDERFSTPLLDAGGEADVARSNAPFNVSLRAWSPRGPATPVI